MSRYVELDVQVGTLEDLQQALTSLGVTHHRDASGERVMLDGSLECAGQPVDVRIPAGTRDCVEDFGFVRETGGKIRLVCGEPDRRRLMNGLVTPLLREVARLRARTLVGDTGADLREVVEPDGTRRIVVKRG